eukprot:g25556.t1
MGDGLDYDQVKQTIFTAGAGNALQAAVASVVRLPLEEVPNFIEDPAGSKHGELGCMRASSTCRRYCWTDTMIVSDRGSEECAQNGQSVCLAIPMQISSKIV